MCRWFKIVKYFIYLSFLLLSACEGTTAATVGADSKIEAVNVEKNIKPVIEKDLWQYIVNRYTLSAPSQKKLYWHIDWFKKNPDYLTRVTKRAKPYLYLVTKEVEKAGLPIEIALLPIVESAYYPFSYSHGTASGLWQFIPSTGRLYGLKDNWWYDGRRDVVASTKAAVKYLTNLNKLFKGDWLLAIAAYNSGPGRVQKAVRKNKKLGKKADFWHLDLPAETKGYVPRLLAVAELIKNPTLYNQHITPIDNQPQVGSVILDSQFDSALIAEWTGLSADELYSLNPGLKRWATPSTGSYALLLPIDRIAEFKKNLDSHPKKGRMRWLRHKIKPGDSLSYLAKKFKTTIEQIKSVNDLNNNTIRVGKYLIVPIAQRSDNYYSLSEDQREKRRMNVKKNGVKVIHIVSSGDSLWKIANKYNTDIKSIIKWNHLNHREPLQIGKKLAIWRPSTSKAEDLSKVVNTGVDISRKINYRVKRGDNLSSIAAKFNVSVNDLKSWNKLDAKKPLQIGQKLKIIVNVINSKMK